MTPTEYAAKLLAMADSPHFRGYRSLLLEAARELERIPGLEMELEDYCTTVLQLRRKLASIRETAGAT